MKYYKTEEELIAYSYAQAQKLFAVRSTLGIEVDTVDQLAELLFNLSIDKMDRDLASDKQIVFDDEIVSIEELSEEETIDITVSKDSLFYANSILTKNSVGLPQSLDWFAAIVSNEELAEMGRQIIIPLKTRYGSKQGVKPQLIKIDWSKMRYEDVGMDDADNSNHSNQPSQSSRHSTGMTAPAKRMTGIPEGIDWGDE